MRTHLAGRLFVAGALAAAPLLLCASAQEKQSDASASAAQPAADVKASEPAKPAGTTDKPDQTSDQSKASTAAYSTGIADVLKMADAKISPDVIKTYVEQAPIAYTPTVTDIIALKEHGVPDNVTAALVKRGAEVRARMIQAGARASNHAAYGGLDPESYEYFRYYYLYPRTLASVYDRLSPYYVTPAYGYYQPAAFNPVFPGGYAHLRRAGFGAGFAP